MLINFKNLFSDFRVRVGVGIFLVVSMYGTWLLTKRNIQETDNATVKCDLVDVVSELNGVVNNIYFEDNAYYPQGSVMVSIEDSMFKAQFEEAKAYLSLMEQEYQLAIERKNIIVTDSNGDIKKLTASFNMSNSVVESALLEKKELESQLSTGNTYVNYLQSEFNRASKLVANHLMATSKYEEIKKSYDIALIERKTIEARINTLASKTVAKRYEIDVADALKSTAHENQKNKLAAAETDIRSAQSNIELARAKLELARIQLERTKIKSRRAGDITNRRVASGDFVEIGQPIASITSCHDGAWIEANFKETQIEKIAKGQTVEVKLDAYPGKKFLGVVDSISNGSGSTFSVLPPENAVGNFTKVVQRFPVKIVVDTQTAKLLRVGMSSVVEVYTNSQSPGGENQFAESTID